MGKSDVAIHLALQEKCGRMTSSVLKEKKKSTMTIKVLDFRQVKKEKKTAG